VNSILEDSSGHFWFGTNSGVSCFDGAANWRTFGTGDGLADNRVKSILEDRSGNLWFGTSGGGVSRYDGSTWRTFTTENGLATNTVGSILEDRSGNLWFGTDGGVSRYEPDRVPPQTVFVTAPPRLSSSRNQSARFTAFGETGIEFSYQLDGAEWSAWSADNIWIGDLDDGMHEFAVRSRDFLSNVDSTAAVAFFEIDATPPAPVISEPSFSQAVRGTVAIRGTAADARFTTYRVETRPSASDSWSGAALLAQSTSPVSNGPLAAWDTSPLADGLYDLRLSVTDTLGLIGNAQVTVLVDNHFPFASETAPATIASAQGGNLYTNSGELHLYFPPRAFPSDALVSLLPTGSAMDTLATGAVQVSPAYHIAWSAPLKKAATLGFSTQGLAPGVLAVYHSAGTAWKRLGGTREAGTLSLAITERGYYALFAETAALEGAASLSAMSFTPRVFSPAGTFANDHVAIGFTLGRSAPVTVRVYNRAGRLVREVVSGETMGPGASLVRWDGRDRGGVYVADGLYLVTVEALGRIQRKTLAIVR
jgi:hypothetical protein